MFRLRKLVFYLAILITLGAALVTTAEARPRQSNRGPVRSFYYAPWVYGYSPYYVDPYYYPYYYPRPRSYYYPPGGPYNDPYRVYYHRMPGYNYYF